MRNNLIFILVAFVPTVLLSAVGILILVFQRAGFDIVFGILILVGAFSFVSGAVFVQRLIRRQAQEVRLQTDFVAKVSHELRTPLASIRMFVDTLREGRVDDPEDVAMCMDTIATETSRLTTMIERLLIWGRMESGRRAYSMRPERVDTLIGEALAQLEPQLQSTEVDIKLEMIEPIPAVNADRTAMVETLLNLLSNAIKYGGDGGLIIIRAYRHKRRVLIEIADRGPGIPKHEQRRIFERFYRGAAQIGGRKPGSGLGLAMAQHVVKAHGGRIRVASQPGLGTCFTIVLRALRDEDAALEVPAG